VAVTTAALPKVEEVIPGILVINALVIVMVLLVMEPANI